jgi:hypothetical protein
VELAGISAESIIMEQQENSCKSGWFDLDQIAKSFPKTADTPPLDTYLANEEAASARIFRLSGPTPPHYHATCAERLSVLSGRRAPSCCGHCPSVRLECQ